MPHLTVSLEWSTALLDARCPRPCGRLFFRYAQALPTLYVETKCRGCHQTVVLTGPRYATVTQ